MQVLKTVYFLIGRIKGHILNFLKKYFIEINRKLFAGTCLLCRMSSGTNWDLCQNCEKSLPWLGSACKICAIPLPVNPVLICGNCLKNPPAFQRIQALFLYTEPVSQLIKKFKFDGNLSIARVLAQLTSQKMQAFYQENKDYPQCIIPVPLHPARLRERGFNQALELARWVSKHLNKPIDYHTCQRIRYTAMQTGLSARERAKNVKGAFSIKKDSMYCHIALIDDVITTGHTVNALSQALQKQGVNRIDVWCCARTGGFVKEGSKKFFLK
jgi:ComF family protein